jgi:hypothetical protein
MTMMIAAMICLSAATLCLHKRGEQGRSRAYVLLRQIRKRFPQRPKY